MAKEPKSEKRWRVISPVPMWHDLFQCHVYEGEDYNMYCTYPDGRRWKYPNDEQAYLDDRRMEIYFAPVGTPRVVHSHIEDAISLETGEHYNRTVYSDAQLQWVGETTFIDKYPPDNPETKE